jgi:hypothetical protein
MLALILFFSRWVRAGNNVYLRRIRSLDGLLHLVSRAVESGQKIHISLGTGRLTDTTTATTLAGLAVLDSIAERGCGSGAAPIVTVADPMVLHAAQDSLRQAFNRSGRPKEFSNNQVELVAPQPVIYAQGASMHLHPKETAANLMIGSFGTEALLLAEPGAQRNITQVAGTDDPQAMATLIAAVDSPVIGEEIYAISAYLNRKPAHLASLKAQDIMRVGVIALIVIATLLRTIGVSLF